MPFVRLCYSVIPLFWWNRDVMQLVWNFCSWPQGKLCFFVYQNYSLMSPPFSLFNSNLFDTFFDFFCFPPHHYPFETLILVQLSLHPLPPKLLWINLPHVFQFTFSLLNVSRLPVEPTGSETCSWLCPSSWHLKSSYMFKAARPTYLVPPTLSIISPMWNRVLQHAVKWIQEKAQLYEDDSFVFLCSMWKMGINVVWSLSAVKALSRCLDG